MENIIIVYAKLNEKNEILELQSSIFLSDATGWTKIDEGQGGDKYAHPQGNYFDTENGELPILDVKGRPNYKYLDGNLVEITEEEKEALHPVQEPQPTEVELLKQQLLETQAQLAEMQYNILLNGGIQNV